MLITEDDLIHTIIGQEKEMEKCEGYKGSNICGRKAEFLITDRSDIEKTFYSCVECPGRIIIENDLDVAEIERLYE
jgi:ferredoxin-like protein FixX